MHSTIELVPTVASVNNIKNGRQGRECWRLKIHTNICRPNVFPLMTLNVKRLGASAIPVSPIVVSPRSGSILLDRLSRNRLVI